MDAAHLSKAVDPSAAGREMHRFLAELFPICRSITGDGFRRTLSAIGERLPLEVHEVPSGTQVFDWRVPREWNIRDAFVKSSRGERVIDFRSSNLHVVSYSVPVRARMSLAELRLHLHTLPEHPDWIPYRTSYYKEAWGFCLAHRKLAELPEDTYEVCIDSTLEDGHLTYGECFLEGESADEVLLSCHACHPSLANDNLSGVALATFLGEALGSVRRRYSYRILFIPGTIGSITWLARNEAAAARIRHGLVITCVGDPGGMTYKRSRRGDAEIDRVCEHVLAAAGGPFRVIDFFPYGYDERQYCSPGFNLAVGSLQRTPHGEFPEYHTSADNPEFVRAESLADSYAKYVAVLSVLEANRTYRNTNPCCEPQLGKRGLYDAVGGRSARLLDQMALLWVLNLADGRHTLLDIAARSGLGFEAVEEAASALARCGLLE
jgi:aminopeptidase-like protein